MIYRPINKSHIDSHLRALHLTVERAVGDTNVGGLATSDTFVIKDASATADIDATYTAAGVTGTADSATVTIDGAAAASDIGLWVLLRL